MLVFLTDVAGILDGSGNLLTQVGAKDGEELLHSGVVTRGMIPKVEACMNALNNGIKSYIVDGRKRDALFGLVDIDAQEPEGTVFLPSA